MLFHHANILVFFLLGFAFVAIFLGLGSLVRPSSPNPAKLSTYECGEPASGSAWINFNIRFYLIALVFLIFDVELAFMYPVAAVFKQWVADGRGLFALTEITIFVGILAVGLAYVWKKGDLDWMKRVPKEEIRAAEPRRAA
jgi:NADH-quinone oxidoreductase subunit A